MVRKTRKCINTVIAAGVMLLAFAGPSFGQLLFRPGMEEAENFTISGYNRYGRTIVSQSSNPRYDYFGNFILNGVQIFHWNEEKINSRHLTGQLDNFSLLDKVNLVDTNAYFYNFFDGLVVLNETNQNFSSRLIVGNLIRTKFSPLTVDMLTLNGVRWDTSFGGNYFSVFSSRASGPLFTMFDAQTKESKLRMAPVYLQGGHMERQVGIFNVSANYVNTYRSNSAISRSNNSMTGTLLNDEKLVEFRPLQFAVKVEDGSRYDAGGPRVYDIYPVINGKIRRDMFVAVTKGNWKADFNVGKKINNPNKDIDQNRYFLDPLRIPDFYGVNNVAPGDDLSGTNILTRRLTHNDPFINLGDLNNTGAPYVECNGEDYLVFWFDLPSDEDVQEVEFKALVSNNYIFSISEIHANKDSDVPKPKLLDRAQATYFDKIYFSQGDVKDESNLGWIAFEYGQPTANMLMSFRVASDVKGFKLSSEYARNLQFKQFPNNKSEKFNRQAEAYYINVSRGFGDNLTLGTEYFKMDPNYTTMFLIHDSTFRELDPAWTPGEVFLDPSQQGNTEKPGGMQSVLNTTLPVQTVEDNDDRDQYPDYYPFRSLRDLNGIYPGQDENGNYRPDTNENDNLMPDYDEPFFLFNVDPDDYDYGLDLNNNNTIDVRENDDKPDYPYDMDRKGYHVFGTYGQDMGWKYTAGYINMEKIAAGGQSKVFYGVADYNKFIPFFADVRFATNAKKVNDNIQDDVFKYARSLSTTLVDSLTYAYNSYSDDRFRDTYKIIDDIMTEKYFDPLQYRDSYTSTSFMDINIFSVPNMTLGVRLKYDLNHQNETSYQNANNIIDRTQVYRAEYRYYLGDLLIQPQVKFQNRKNVNNDGFTRIFHEQRFYPIIKLEYPLTVRTSLKAGAQGIPGLNATVRNLMNDQLDFDTRNLVVMLSNESFYSGYDFSLNFGFESKWQKFNGVARQVYNRTDRFFFVRLVVGLEPIS